MKNEIAKKKNSVELPPEAWPGSPSRRFASPRSRLPVRWGPLRRRQRLDVVAAAAAGETWPAFRVENG